MLPLLHNLHLYIQNVGTTDDRLCKISGSRSCTSEGHSLLGCCYVSSFRCSEGSYCLYEYIINQQHATLAVLCLLTTTSMLYMFQTPFASIIRSTINCNSSQCSVLFHGHFGHGIVQCAPTLTSVQDLFHPNS